MSIDLQRLGQELLAKGTDDRLTRALLILARHVNEALEKTLQEAVEESSRETNEALCHQDYIKRMGGFYG